MEKRLVRALAVVAKHQDVARNHELVHAEVDADDLLELEERGLIEIDYAGNWLTSAGRAYEEDCRQRFWQGFREHQLPAIIGAIGAIAAAVIGWALVSCTPWQS